MKLVPLGDRVVLKQLVAEETTKSGIVLPGQNKEKPQQAEVIAVGPGGLVDGKNYIEINLRAYALYSDVIYVTAGEYEGSYDFTAYANGTMKEYAGNDKLADLLLDLYNYAKEAYEYKSYVDANGGVMN